MDYQTGFFYLFAAVLLFAAFRVITSRNPVHAVLYLMLAFSQAAALWGVAVSSDGAVDDVATAALRGGVAA